MSMDNAAEAGGKENIHVYLRLRPISELEYDTGDSNIWKVHKNAVEVDRELYNDLIDQNSKKVNFVLTSSKRFYYNSCFEDDT